MTRRTKQIALLSLMAALAAVLLLSASLSGMQLKAGMPFPGGGANGGAMSGTEPLAQIEPSRWPLVEVIFSILLLVIVVYVPTRLIALVRIRNLLKLAAVLLLVLAIVSLLPRVEPGAPTLVPNEPSQYQPPPSIDHPVTPLGRPPVELLWLTAGGILLGIFLLAVDVLRRRRKPDQAADPLLKHAEDALEALRAGQDFPNVIVRCYLQMTEVLKAERKIERHQSMTPRDFEEWLAYKGIPVGPVQELTLLFEKARYSQERMSRKDEQTGTECLRQIAEHCRRTRGHG